MERIWVGINSNIERAVYEILRSRARSKIYIFLLRKNGAKTEEIIRGTRLHPSTVRETLSKMYEQKLILRKKLKNDSIGKNPYIYYSISPLNLLKKYADEIEDKLNKIANLTISSNESKNFRQVKINISERVNKK